MLNTPIGTGCCLTFFFEIGLSISIEYEIARSEGPSAKRLVLHKENN